MNAERLRKIKRKAQLKARKVRRQFDQKWVKKNAPNNN